MKATKTPKCFVGDDFIRSENGSDTAIKDRSGAIFANISLYSKKDLRNAVDADAKGRASWSKHSPYNRDFTEAQTA
jgi:acyl-CoA reductase-like NAD-dependent aldehyde dehydrogenase